MKKFGKLQHNKPLQFPLNDASINWPSFQSCNVSDRPLNNKEDKIIQHSSMEFRDTESEKGSIPEKLEEFCSFYSEKECEKKKFLRKYEKYWLIEKLLTNITNLIVLILSIILPLTYYSKFRYKRELFSYDSPSMLYFPTLLLLTILQILLLIGQVFLKTLQRKSKKIKISKIVNIIIYYVPLITPSIPTYGLLSYYMFITSFRVLNKLSYLVYGLDSKQLIIAKMICVVVFHCHLFACLWGVCIAQIEQEVNYSENFYISLQLLFFKVEAITLDIHQNNLVILNFSFNLALLLYLVFCVISLQMDNQDKQNKLEASRVYFQSLAISIKEKIILFHYLELFQLSDLSERLSDKKKQILDYVKINFLRKELGQIELINNSILEQISDKGQLLSNKGKNFQTKINGLYIILSGQTQISFQGESLPTLCSSKQIMLISLIETLIAPDSNIWLHEKRANQDILYFYLEKKEFLNILVSSEQKEIYHMIRDEIVFSNNTRKLGIRCLFCNQFHPCFNCATFNVKHRFTFEKITQDRTQGYIRKQTKKSRSGIYYQITHQGSSMNNENNFIDDQSSESFEAFSDFSSEQQISYQGMIVGEQLCKQTSLIPSLKRISKDQLQIDYISDRMTEPIISSTLLRNLVTSPDNALRSNQHSNVHQQMQFQDFESLFDIDKWQEYSQYNINYNLSNEMNIQYQFMSYQYSHNFQNKSVQQIVQELMYDEYLERENMLRNAFLSSPLKSVKKKMSLSKNRYNNYLSQSPSQLYSPSVQNNQCKVIGVATKQKKYSTPSNHSITKLLDIVSPANKVTIKVNTKTKDIKPKELRGLSISDHMTREKCLFPAIQRISQEKQTLVFPIPNFNDDLEGYKLKSEEMSLEIDEYMKMKQNNGIILPSIY